MGYERLKKLSAFGISITVEKNAVKIGRELPPCMESLISTRARIMSEILSVNTLKLTMENLRNEKFHPHFNEVMTGAIINKGTQWKISKDKVGTVDCGHDFFMSKNLEHRSYPVQQNEKRFVWTLSNPVKLYL